MKNALVMALAIGATLAGLTAGAQASVLDLVQAPTGYFTPDDSQKTSSPYYRYYDGDWGWTHGAIGGTITTATLQIAAYDVDANAATEPEFDEIFAYDSGTWVSLGFLAGSNNTWAFTDFTLGASFFDDIAAGLQVKMDIDTTHTSDYWAVALSKSALQIDGTVYVDPNPAPEPATLALLGLGLVGLAGLRRKA